MKKILSFVLPLLSLFVTIWLYFPVINGHFNWEDGMILGDAIKASTSGNFKFLFVPWYGGYARLLWQIISYIFYNLFGYNAQPFFILILFLHGLNCLLTFQLAKKLTKSVFVAFFASLLYGVYQVNYSSISWISSGIKDIPMTTFFLISILLFIIFRESNKKKFLVFSYFSFFFSMASEFKSLPIPLVIFIYDFLLTNKKRSLFRYFIEYLPYAIIVLFFLLTFNKYTLGMFAPNHNWFFWRTFFMGLPLFIFPISRIFWIRVYTDAHKLTFGLTDEKYLFFFGMAIFLGIVFFEIILFFKKQQKQAVIIFFLFLGVLINYLPVLLMVFSGHQSPWMAVTVNMRYFLICSPLAAILTAYLTTQIFSIPIKIKILPFIVLSFFVYWYIQDDKKLLSQYFLNWTYKSKAIFSKIKNDYPFLPKETLFVIEGTENESKYSYFQHRYLYENIFALYAIPNNNDYLYEQRQLPFSPNEAMYRTLPRLLTYTNIKDILVGNHEHLYQSDPSYNIITLNLPWRLPAYDRIFLGTVYGYYEPKKIIDFKFSSDGNIQDVTLERRREVNEFLKYFCFENGVKKCYAKPINNSLILFSPTGKSVMEFLIKQSLGPLPPIDKITIPSNI